MTLPTLPSILAYPEIQKFDLIPEIVDQFVYVIKSYPTKGLTVLVYRKDETVYFKFGDFAGKTLDPTNNKQVKLFMEKYSAKFVELMATARIPQAIYYLVAEKDKMRLVDMRVSLNKFAGPGMLRDLYGKIIDTQEVLKTIQLNSETIEAIKKGTGSYKGGLILKTSVFKTVTRGNAPKLMMYPMYAKVR
jgi:hypothetical protein